MEGRVVLVAGGSGGIGRAVAKCALEQGAIVVLGSRGAERGEASRTYLESQPQYHGRVHYVPFDMSVHSSCRALVDATVSICGGLDSLVMAAGADGDNGSLADVSDQTWASLLTTNLLGVIWLASAACEKIAQRGGGAVVLFGSASSLRGSKSYPSYALSKGSSTQIAQHLAVQWGKQRVRVNCIAPSLIRTEFTRDIWDTASIAAKAAKSYPLGRFGDPPDVAGLAIALLSQAGAWITGQTIVVDGGMAAGMGAENAD
jgi:NAD(P)-dependent dehydrogenase (short-subunit alcohol dehydrogenase family)